MFRRITNSLRNHKLNDFHKQNETHKSLSLRKKTNSTYNKHEQKLKSAMQEKFNNNDFDINFDSKVQEWLEELDKQIRQNIHQINFTIDDLAAYMNISKRQLYRLIHERIGQTPHQYLKNYRLNYARKLLESGEVTSVKAAAYSTGFPNTVYFSRQFKTTFGILPSELL